jgi:hypothetical protein
LRCLKEAVTSLENVTIVPVALGDREGVVAFEQGADALGATSRKVAGGAGKPSGKATAVSLASGDHLIASGSSIGWADVSHIVATRVE